MLCTNCGSDINDNYSGTITNLINGFSNLKGLVIAAFALILLFFIITASKSSKKINLEEFVEVSISGYDRYATADVDLDIEGLYAEIAKTKGIKASSGGEDKDSSEDSYDIQDFDEIEVAINSIYLDLSPKDSLSNGDRVTVDISYNNDIAKEIDITFAGKNVSKKVENLKPITEIDPFKELTVSFSGISPQGQLNYSYDGDSTYISEGSFLVDKEEDLRNGDLVTVSIDSNDAKTISHGYILKTTSTSYEVEGLDEYVEEYANLPSAFIEELKSEAEATIDSHVESFYVEESSLNDLTYAGYIFNTAKPEGNNVKNYNEMYIIYSGILSNSQENFSATKIYIPVMFSNIIKKDNDISYGENNGISGSSSIDNTRYSTDGYTDPAAAYREIVESNLKNYNSEIGDGFEEYEQKRTISKIRDISESYRNELAKDAIDIIESYVARDYHVQSHLQDIKLKGAYWLLAKNHKIDIENNKYIIVYSGIVSHEEGRFDPTLVYFPVEYHGIVSITDDDYMVSSNEGILGYSPIGDSRFRTRGYVDGLEMFKDIVTVNRDLYTYEVSDGLKEFGE